jgi:fructosamine-3-kinase
MILGEYESLEAIHAVSPNLVPEPYGWGKYDDGSDTYFLLAEFREVGKQPPDSAKFTKRLAEMHKKSQSPTGKFGFHVTTCHAKLPQVTDCWEDSWAALYRKQLAHMIELDEAKHGEWLEFKMVCRLVLDKVIPRLLEPLQSDGRSIKPCLVQEISRMRIPPQTWRPASRSFLMLRLSTPTTSTRSETGEQRGIG